MSLLKALVPLYRLGLGAKRSVVRARRLNVPVISVGNITAGGAGKTPAVIHLANELAAAGKQVAVLSRGYGRKSRTNLMVGRKGVVLASYEEAGDEPLIIAKNCREATVAVGKKRDVLGRELLKKHAFDAVLLDDGFQHWRLHRDLDLVLIDSRTSVFSQRLLPAGRLREPLEALRRADAFILTNVSDPDLAAAERDLLKESFGERPVLFSRPRFGGVFDLASESPVEIAGRHVGAVSGLARPENFERMILSSGASQITPLRFADHHDYVLQNVRGILEAARHVDLLLTTEKDAVKLKKFKIPRLAVASLTIDYLPEGDLPSPLSLVKEKVFS